MKKKKWLKVLVIVVIIILIMVIGVLLLLNAVSKTINSTEAIEMDYMFNEYTVENKNITSYVRGTGEITSFNIQTLDVPSYSSIKKNYVSDGATVSSKQKLLQIKMDGVTKTIKSPIAGMYFVTEVNGNKEYKVYDLKKIGIEMLVSENDVAKLKVGQKAIVKITALKKEVEGSVSYISKLPTDGKFKVRVKINYNNDIRFGYGTSVKVIIEEKENVLVIPYSALEMDDDEKYYVIKKEHRIDYYNKKINSISLPDTSKTYVEVGTITNSEVEIKSGLQPGDVIIEWFGNI